LHPPVHAIVRQTENLLLLVVETGSYGGGYGKHRQYRGRKLESKVLKHLRTAGSNNIYSRTCAGRAVAVSMPPISISAQR
jgi:hypothetical protein